MFIAGRMLQGLSTSLLLIAAVPPLVLGYPVEQLRVTAVIMNMCIFGAVALGPTIGGIQASAHGWRPLFWIVAGISLTALALSLLTFEDAPPANRSAPWDPVAIALAASGSLAAFFGASQLLTQPFLDASTFVPLVGGLALIVALGRQPIQVQAPALDHPEHAGQHDAGRGNRGRAVRRGRLGVRDGADRKPARPPVRTASPRAALPARVRGRRAHGGRARRGVQQTPDPLPAAGRDGVPRRWDRGLPHPASAQPGAHVDRLRAGSASASARPSHRPCSWRASRCPPRISSACLRSSSCCAPSLHS